MSNSKFAVVFDFDGTLTPKKFVSTMAIVDQAGLLSPGALQNMEVMRKSYLGLYSSGQLSDDKEREWLQRTAAQYAQDRLSVAGAHQALAAVTLRPGVKECFQWLEDANVPVAIISYGIQPFIDSVLDHHGAGLLVQLIYACRMVTSGDGSCYVDWIKNTAVSPGDKGEKSRRFAELFGVSPEQLLAVGDSRGDRCLGFLRENRLGLADHAADAAKIAPIMGEVVITEDFSPVQAWLRNKMDL